MDGKNQERAMVSGTGFSDDIESRVSNCCKSVTLYKQLHKGLRIDSV